MRASSLVGWLIPIGVLGLLTVTVGNAFVPAIHKVLHLSPQLFPDDATGTVTSAGATGSWTMHVNSCESGERRQFFGAAFFDDSQPTFGGHIIVTPGIDEQLSLNEGNGSKSSSVWTQAQCSVWDMDVQRTNSSYNDVFAVAGHARFDCTDSTAHVSGNLTFNSCH